jgi:hypothetical protein
LRGYAIPDIHMEATDIIQDQQDPNKVTVCWIWTGTHVYPLRARYKALPMNIEPAGPTRQLRLSGRYIAAFDGNKIADESADADNKTFDELVRTMAMNQAPTIAQDKILIGIAEQFINRKELRDRIGDYWPNKVPRFEDAFPELGVQFRRLSEDHRNVLQAVSLRVDWEMIDRYGIDDLVDLSNLA